MGMTRRAPILNDPSWRVATSRSTVRFDTLRAPTASSKVATSSGTIVPTLRQFSRPLQVETIQSAHTAKTVQGMFGGPKVSNTSTRQVFLSGRPGG